VACAARQTPAPIEYLLRKAGLGQEESMPSSGRLNFMSQRTSKLSDRTTDMGERETLKAKPEGQARFAPAPCSAIRPFEEQTLLERTLRAHLWQPTDALRRAEENLPKHAKRKEYREAAECQTRIIEAESEIKVWTHLLELYEAERQSPSGNRTG
jgi:hypothetical protein